MDIDGFIARNEATWSRLDRLVAKAGRRSSRLSGEEIDDLVACYERAATHLSIARTSFADPALTARLSRLIARASVAVYGTRASTSGSVLRFAATTFPAAIWHSRWFVVVAAVLFAAPALSVGVWISGSSTALEAVGPPALRAAYVEEDFEAYYSSAPAGAFATQVTTNNIRVSALAFAGGIALCVPTAAVLALNGGNLGVAAGLFAAAGEQARFWGLVAPHGLLEITAVFVAGGAGLRLGWTVIAPGDRSRQDALVEEARRAVAILMGLVAVFTVAGLIEGFVTGSSLPTLARVAVGVAAESVFVAGVVAGGRRAAARGLTGALGEEGGGRERSRSAGYSRPAALISR